jgi:hypothetical protein
VITSVYGSPVVGYVRSAKLDDPELDVLEQQIRRFAKEHGYNLVKVFREEGISSVAAWRPALQKVIQGLDRHEWVGVIVPNERHWSSNAAIASKIRNRLDQSGWVASSL